MCLFSLEKCFGLKKISILKKEHDVRSILHESAQANGEHKRAHVPKVMLGTRTNGSLVPKVESCQGFSALLSLSLQT